MDTSYSADVLWPLSQLTAIARASARATVANAIGSGGTDGVLVDSSANAASAALSSAAVLPSAFAVDTSTEWITYADFEKRRLQGIKSDDAAAAVTAVPKSTSSVPEPASSVSFKSTRSPQAAFELTIEVPNSTDGKLPFSGILIAFIYCMLCLYYFTSVYT